MALASVRRFDVVRSTIDYWVMARQVTTHIIDDLDGTKDAQEIQFAFDGKDYVIDLSSKNRKAFEKAIRPYLDAARPQRRSRQTRSATKASSGRRDLRAVREWAKGRGIEVSDRGRVPVSVLEQYDADQS